MKKVIFIACLFLLSPFYSSASAVSDATLLKEKLAKFQQINADFIQRVVSPEGELLNESEGQFTISRPGKFRWETLTPEEELIVSDGKTMWLYSPFIEQVTLINLSDAIQGTPFVLLSGADDLQWKNYKVTKNNNKFTIVSLNSDERKNSFIFEFAKNGNISRFFVIEEQGQSSEFTLTYKPVLENIGSNYFTFKIPADVEIDDQR